MKFEKEQQRAVAELVASKLGVEVLQTRVRLASQMEDAPHDRRSVQVRSVRPDRHQVAMLLGCKSSVSSETLAFLFNTVPDRVYHRTFKAIDEAALDVIQALNFHIQDRLSEDGDNQLSTMVFPMEMDKQPPDFPNKFYVLVDLYF